MADVQITMSARDAGVWAKFMEVRKAAELVGVEMDVIARKSGRAGQTMQGMTGGMLSDLPRAAAQFAGIGSTLGALYTASRTFMNEVRRFEETRLGYVDPFIEAAKAKERFREIVNPTNDKAAVEALMGRIAGYGVAGGIRNQGDVFDLASNIYSAVPDEALAEKLVRRVSETYGALHPKEDLRALGGAIGDYLQSMSPAEQARVDVVQEVMGSMMAMAKWSRTVGPQDTTNLMRGATMGKQSGLTDSESFSLSAIASKYSLDEHGRRSSHAVVSTILDLNKRSAEVAGKGFGSEADLKAFMGLNSLEQRQFVLGGAEKGATVWQQALLARMIGSAAAVKYNLPDVAALAQSQGWHEYFGGIEGERSAKRFQEMYMAPSGPLRQKFESEMAEAQRDIPSAGPKSKVFYDRYLRERGAEVRAHAVAQGTQGATEAGHPLTFWQGELMKSREEHDNAMGAGYLRSGINWLRSLTNSWMIGEGEGPVALRDQYRRQAFEMLSTEAPWVAGNRNDPRNVRKALAAMSPAKRAEYERLVQAANAIERDLPADQRAYIEQYPLEPGDDGGGLEAYRRYLPAAQRAARRRRAVAQSQSLGIDQSEIDFIKSLRSGNTNLGPVRIQIEDQAGRPLTRRKSLPRAAEQLAE